MAVIARGRFFEWDALIPFAGVQLQRVIPRILSMQESWKDERGGVTCMFFSFFLF